MILSLSATKLVDLLDILHESLESKGTFKTLSKRSTKLSNVDHAGQMWRAGRSRVRLEEEFGLQTLEFIQSVKQDDLNCKLQCKLMVRFIIALAYTSGFNSAAAELLPNDSRESEALQRHRESAFRFYLREATGQ